MKGSQSTRSRSSKYQNRKSSRTCKGICKKYQVKKPRSGGRYEAGHGRCQTCDIWIDYRGGHAKDGSAATIESTGWFCNCCNYRIRRNPRHGIYKSRLRQSKTKEDAKIDLSYFNKCRARMLRELGRAIIAKESSDSTDEYDKFLPSNASVSDIESEFNATIDQLIKLAKTTKPPNKVSMIAEFERVRHMLGRIPTKMDFSTNSKLYIYQYEEEFGSWEHLLARLGYDPFYKHLQNQVAGKKDPKSGRPSKTIAKTSQINSNIDETKQDNLQKISHDADTNVLHQRIQKALHIIKSAKNGARVEDLRSSLEITREKMSDIVTRLVRTDNISRKEARKKDSTDTILQYNPSPRTQNLQDAGADEQNATTLHNDIEAITHDMLGEYHSPKRRIDKNLKKSLIKEYISSRSMKNIIDNHPELSKKHIQAHVRTPLRLPEDLRKLNEEGLHPDPELSLHMALYATDHCNWDGQKDTADAVTQMARDIAEKIASGYGNKYLQDSKRDNPTRSRADGAKVPASIAVWIATATLHREHGKDATFSNHEIIDKVVEQSLCSVSQKTISDHVSGHCVANAPDSNRMGHRKTYRTGPGTYRLYRKGDPHHPHRKAGLMAPLPFQLPKGYEDLREWYDGEYCR